MTAKNNHENELAMKRVHDSALPRAQKVIGMAYAWESERGAVAVTADFVSQQTSYSHHSVQEITKELIDLGFLVPAGTAESGDSAYRLDLEELPTLSQPRPAWEALFVTPEQYEFYSGRNFAEDFRDRMAEKRCAYCGEYRPDTQDHVIPKSQGGSNEPANLVYSCRPCNSKKGARTPEQAGMPILFVKESRVAR